MAAYKELVKDFEKIRSYIREFYVYGYKSREEYDAKSLRSYDDERRRIESWLSDYVRFVRMPGGKNVWLSVDCRAEEHNPFFRVWKTKSFTDGDITLHFILFDILFDPSVQKSLPELMDLIDRAYLSGFDAPMMFDESTVRKKLKEYIEEGIILAEKQGRKMMYRRAETLSPDGMADALDFFCEVAPCGVIGSFLLDKLPAHTPLFGFKHHYITGTLDSDVMATLFAAMHQKCHVTMRNRGKANAQPKEITVVPLKLYISTQNGRQNLLAYHPKANRINAYRLDYLSDVRMGEPCEQYDDLRAAFARREEHMWGVNCKWNLRHLEHVEFTVAVGADEGYIVDRLEREKRCGRVERVDDTHYRFCADIFDTTEIVPWVRTFIGRITQLRFSNRTVENRFRQDLRDMYALYGIGEVQA